MFDYYEIPNVRKICHQAKQGDPAALEIIAQSLAVHVRPEDVVTPVPGRTGDPGIMMAVCQRVADIAECAVWDGIRGANRPSQYTAKKTQGGLNEAALGFYLQAPPPALTGQGRHLIIDTIQDTGLTLNAAINLLPGAEPHPYATVDKLAEQRAQVVAMASAFSEVMQHHDAGFYFEEGGCWAFAGALHDCLARAGIPSTIRYAEGDFIHCYTDIGGQLFDHQGSVVTVPPSLTTIAPHELCEVASRHGVDAMQFQSDMAWAEEILQDASDIAWGAPDVIRAPQPATLTRR